MAEQLAPGEFRLRAKADGGTHTIILEGELDLACAEEVELQLKAADRSEARQIVLDLEGLTFIDSTGVALLVEAIKRSEQDSSRLRIKRSGAIGVRRVLKTTGIEDRMPYLD